MLSDVQKNFNSPAIIRMRRMETFKELFIIKLELAHWVLASRVIHVDIPVFGFLLLYDPLQFFNTFDRQFSDNDVSWSVGDITLTSLTPMLVTHMHAM